MNALEYNIIPYEVKYEPDLLALEKNSPQGKWIQLEMVKESFERRSQTFEKYQIYLAIDLNGELLGCLAASIVPIIVNGRKSDVGYCYDVRVANHARGHGLTKKMGRHAYKNFWLPNKVVNVFLTMKKGNEAVYKSAGALGQKLYTYPFFYLTIPTNKRLKSKQSQLLSEKLTVTSKFCNEALDSFFYTFKGELKVWKANLIYHLKIRKLHFVIKLANNVLGFFHAYGKQFPKESDELCFGILIYKTMQKNEEINTVLSALQKQDIGYLLVACSNKSNMYSRLKPLAINCYGYEICSNFPLNPNDNVSLDIRCL